MKKIISGILCIAIIISCSLVTYASNIDSSITSIVAQNGDPIHNLSDTSLLNSLRGDVATTRDELLQPLPNDYRSRTEATYHDINGEDVTVYGFYRDVGESGNNPNFSQALMLYQCIKYKEKHPDEPVYISIQSFHFSVVLGACVDPTKPDYGHLKNLFDEEYNNDGYYRLSYLLVEAAKRGIEVCVVGQLDAAGTIQENGVYKPDLNFATYFNSHLNDDAYIAGKKVSDFMDFGNCRWTSYGDKSAADMMHNKTCSVSNYIDNNGVEHGPAIWLGSINIDGVNINEQNGNDSIQTAVVVTGHEPMRQAIYNYAKLVAAYCDQEDVIPFRVEAIKRTNEQVKLIQSGRGNEIPRDEQIIYLGTENDSVFELYFTPLGGSFSTWDTTFNPFVKYIAAMLAASESDEYIECIWSNPKYNQTYELADIMLEAIKLSFEKNGNKNSILDLHLPGADYTYFNKLVAGTNIGFKFVNEHYVSYHTKDLQLSYKENGVRQYVSILNSLNMHEGSAYHQTNTILVIKENDKTGNNFYVEYAALIIKNEYAALAEKNLDPLSRRVTGEK